MKINDMVDAFPKDAVEDVRPNQALVMRWLGVSIILDWFGADLAHEAQAVGEDNILENVEVVLLEILHFLQDYGIPRREFRQEFCIQGAIHLLGSRLSKDQFHEITDHFNQIRLT